MKNYNLFIFNVMICLLLSGSVQMLINVNVCTMQCSTSLCSLAQVAFFKNVYYEPLVEIFLFVFKYRLDLVEEVLS